MQLSFTERLAVRLLLKVKISELHGEAFEDFFQELMSSKYPDFVNVRTAGRLGDLGSDGLRLHDRKLYACYGPEVFNAERVAHKFESDLTKAAHERKDQFDTFVFVHNDLRGIHPEVSALIATAAASHSPTTFEIFGFTRFRDELVQLTKVQVEDILKFELPVRDLGYQLPLEELIPLLEHLAKVRNIAPTQEPVPRPSQNKLNFVRFTSDTQEELRREFHLGAEIERYYESGLNPRERDEVALAFNEEFLRLRSEHSNPDDIVFHLEQYVLGNVPVSIRQRRGAQAVIGFFFQTCDIFDNPPLGWSASLQPEDGQ